jgi:hypothetical protein
MPPDGELTGELFARMAVVGAAADPARAQASELVGQLIDAVARPLMETTPDTFDAELDAAAERYEDHIDLRNVVAQVVRVSTPTHRVVRPTLESLRRNADDATAALLDNAFSDMEQTLAAVKRYYEHQRSLAEAIGTSYTMPKAGAQLRARDVRAPEIAELILEQNRGGAAALGIGAYERARIKMNDWRSRMLADAFAKGMRALLRVIASSPGADVPLDVVPQDQRIDFGAIAETNAGRARTVQRLRDEGLASGAEVWPPFDPD